MENGLEGEGRKMKSEKALTKAFTALNRNKHWRESSFSVFILSKKNLSGKAVLCQRNQSTKH